mmetsp:Transcript_12877/g.36914  ORF Transcript_12877/g.36914 Transcript_12877/m.36914 type:complete len:204 (-) Transcript_12877:1557-2168(-)
MRRTSTSWSAAGTKIQSPDPPSPRSSRNCAKSSRPSPRATQRQLRPPKTPKMPETPETRGTRTAAEARPRSATSAGPHPRTTPSSMLDDPRRGPRLPVHSSPSLTRPAGPVRQVRQPSPLCSRPPTRLTSPRPGRFPTQAQGPSRRQPSCQARLRPSRVLLMRRPAGASRTPTQRATVERKRERENERERRTRRRLTVQLTSI